MPVKLFRILPVAILPVVGCMTSFLEENVPGYAPPAWDPKAQRYNVDDTLRYETFAEFQQNMSRRARSSDSLRPLLPKLRERLITDWFGELPDTIAERRLFVQVFGDGGLAAGPWCGNFPPDTSLIDTVTRPRYADLSAPPLRNYPAIALYSILGRRTSTTWSLSLDTLVFFYEQKRDPDDIHTSIRARLKPVRDLYQRSLHDTPGLAGRATLCFSILRNGKVQNVHLDSSSLHHPSFETNLVDIAQHWRFKPVFTLTPRHMVRYPLTFSR